MNPPVDAPASRAPATLDLYAGERLQRADQLVRTAARVAGVIGLGRVDEDRRIRTDPGRGLARRRCPRPSPCRQRSVRSHAPGTAPAHAGPARHPAGPLDSLGHRPPLAPVALLGVRLDQAVCSRSCRSAYTSRMLPHRPLPQLIQPSHRLLHQRMRSIHASFRLRLARLGVPSAMLAAVARHRRPARSAAQPRRSRLWRCSCSLARRLRTPARCLLRTRRSSPYMVKPPAAGPRAVRCRLGRHVAGHRARCRSRAPGAPRRARVEAGLDVGVDRPEGTARRGGRSRQAFFAGAFLAAFFAAAFFAAAFFASSLLGRRLLGAAEPSSPARPSSRPSSRSGTGSRRSGERP